MKRTYGATKPSQQRERRVIITVNKQTVGFIRARSLRAALEVFFKEHLKPAGWFDPVYVGNSFTALCGDDHERIVLVAFAHEVSS